MRIRSLLLMVLLVCAGTPVLHGDVDASLLPPPNPWQYLPLQRVHALLARSTREKPETVRVLIYGQSITRQEWWLAAASSLRRSYPDAKFVIENRAIGAFDASYLIKTAEIDVYPFQPDLIFFHAYGPYGAGREWEQILRRFRSRTCADIILLGNHPRQSAELSEPTDPALIPVPSEAWLNDIVSVSLANELGLCFPNNRNAWKAYLNARHESPDVYLRDGWHFNLEGSAVQAAILEPYTHPPRVVPPLDPYNNGRVSTYPVGTGGLSWIGGHLRLEFLGNRIDVVAASGPTRRCQVRIDGKTPSSLPSGRIHGKVPPWRGEIYGWPALLRVGATAPLLSETWVMRITGWDAANPTHFTFRVSGTKSGPDGEGTSTQLFVSKSGRVRIDPADWWLRFPPGQSQQGIDLIWSTQDHAIDEYLNVTDASAPEVGTVTLANDLGDGPHVLELISDDATQVPAIESLRVYHPAGSPWSPAESAPPLRLLATQQGVLASWSAMLDGVRLAGRRGLAEAEHWISEPVDSRFGLKGTLTGNTESWGFFRLKEATDVLPTAADVAPKALARPLADAASR